MMNTYKTFLELYNEHLHGVTPQITRIHQITYPLIPYFDRHLWTIDQDAGGQKITFRADDTEKFVSVVLEMFLYRDPVAVSAYIKIYGNADIILQGNGFNLMQTPSLPHRWLDAIADYQP